MFIIAISGCMLTINIKHLKRLVMGLINTITEIARFSR